MRVARGSAMEGSRWRAVTGLGTHGCGRQGCHDNLSSALGDSAYWEDVWGRQAHTGQGGQSRIGSLGDFLVSLVPGDAGEKLSRSRAPQGEPTEEPPGLPANHPL